MKSKTGILIALSLMAASAAYSQEVDDMYFTSKDRTKLVSARPVSYATVAQADDAQLNTTTNGINPTDSYSGRGENPEYSTSNGVQNGEPQYFNSNYQPTGVNQNLSNNCSGCNTPYYGNYNNYYGNSMYGMNSMYGYGSPYGSMGMYGMGMYGMGMGYPSYGMGYGMGYGLGMSYGMGYGSYGMGYGMGYPYSSMYGMGYGGYGYYPSTIVIADYGNSQSYGRRGSRSGAVNNSSYYNRSNSGTGTSGRATAIGGRSSSQTMNSQYYQRGWKTNPNIVTGSGTSGRSSFWSNPGSSNSNMGGTRSNWGSGSGSAGRSSFGGSGFSGGGFSGGGHSGGGFSGGGGGGRGRH